jgi:RNA polymerase sigma-70 factor (ECF subfamily)
LRKPSDRQAGYHSDRYRCSLYATSGYQIICGDLPADQRKGTRVDDPVDYAELLARTSAGDRAAFAELYRATSPRLFAIALRMLRASDLAEDALQNAYVLIWQKADRYHREQGHAMAWMTTIVRNCAIDVLRSQTRVIRVPEVSGSDAEPVIAVDADALWASLRTGDRLRQCLEKLQDLERVSICLAYYAGKNHEEIALTLKRPLGSVKSWVRRGLIKLKDCMEE